MDPLPKLSLALEWVLREPPLPTAGLVANGPQIAAVALAFQAHFARYTERVMLTALRICRNDDWFVALGPAEELPWVDGVTYIGWDRNLLTPTTLRPLLPTFLIERAVAARVSSAAHPVTIALPDLFLLFEPSTGPIDGEQLRILGQS
jgi:hypothetical protein